MAKTDDPTTRLQEEQRRSPQGGLRQLRSDPNIGQPVPLVVDFLSEQQILQHNAMGQQVRASKTICFLY